MIRKLTVWITGLALVVGIPIAALGISRVDFNPEPATAQEQTTTQVTAADPSGVVTQEQVQTRTRAQIHMETGVPEGFEPVQTQQRLHQQDGVGGQHQGGGQGQHAAGDCTHDGQCDNGGTCTHEGGPAGSGPHGPGNGG